MRQWMAAAMIAVLVAGCGGSVPPTASTAASPGNPGPASGEPAGSGSTAFPTTGAPSGSPNEAPSGGPSEATDLPAFGSATYVPDTSAAQSVTYAPSDPLSSRVNVTDAAGTFWSLSIPAGALLQPTTITMTPLKTITPAGLPGPILGGILLEPAGTAFLEPAMLSAYKGPAAQAAILTGDAQGVVRLAVPSGEAWKTVAVEHFSPWYLVDADDPAWIPAFDTVAQDGEAAAKDAAAILKQPIDVPAAPSIPFACPDKNGSSAKPDPIAAFIEQLRAPEAGLIARIVAGAHQQLLAGASHEDQLDVANQLMSRLVKKAAAMLKATKPTADTVLPAAIAATAISRQALSMAVDYSDLGAAIPVFVDAALKDTIGRIRRDHDYRQIQVIWSIASQSALLGGGATGPDVDGALARALQFNANLSVDESSPEATWAMSGIVRMEYPGPQDPNGDVLKGEARISDITYRDTIGLTLNPVPFRVQASLADVDACAGTASFGVSQFYMDNESYKDDKGGGMKLGRSWINWEYFYGDKGGRDGWTWFPVKLHNGDPQWVDETIQAGDDGWFAEFSIVLNHQGS